MEDSRLNQTNCVVDELVQLVETLRGKHGCPWDKKQTPRKVIVYLMEEVYELADAIESGNAEEIRQELGDVLFHIVFITRMFQERGEFDLQEVVRTITEKMIRRHPHVFGEQTIDSSEEVIENWHKIKLNEKKSSRKHSLLDSVPLNLPALIRAYQISDRAAKSGFDWTSITGALHNAQEELDGLKAGFTKQDNTLLSREFGDLLLTLVNIARLAKIHPETALAGSVKTFEKRLKKMEELVSNSKRDLADVSREEKALIWEKAKKSVR